MNLICDDQRSAVQIALQQFTEERRLDDQAVRNAERLRRWRVRWWREFGWWPRTPRVASNVIPMERRRQDRAAAMAHPV
jgi:hypothetical protein